MNSEELRAKVKLFRWYHEIEIEEGVSTTPEERFDVSWTLIKNGMDKLSLSGKQVLDIGARDGKFSFESEKRGAKSVLAIDNDLSTGGVWLAGHIGSGVEFKALNLYELDPEKHGTFDVILFLGVLYHLRYPMNGLRKITNCLRPGGMLAIESGMLDRHEMPLMFCPATNSPYEQTSCTFFNVAGLTETLWSFGCTVKSAAMHPEEDGKEVRRMWIEAEKTHDMPESLRRYWEDLHQSHS